MPPGRRAAPRAPPAAAHDDVEEEEEEEEEQDEDADDAYDNDYDPGDNAWFSSKTTKTLSVDARLALWEGCNGQCLVCSVPMHKPREDKTKPHTFFDTMLFKYRLLNDMQAAHLVDEWVIKLADSTDPERIKQLLTIPIQFERDWKRKLKNLTADAKRRTACACQKCNAQMR